MTVKVGRFAEFWPFNGVIIAWIGSSVACDLLITVTLTMILVRSIPARDSKATVDYLTEIDSVSYVVAEASRESESGCGGTFDSQD